MDTASYKRTYSLPFTFDDVLKVIKSFSKREHFQFSIFACFPPINFTSVGSTAFTHASAPAAFG